MCVRKRVRVLGPARGPRAVRQNRGLTFVMVLCPLPWDGVAFAGTDGRVLSGSSKGTRKRCAASNGLRKALSLPQVFAKRAHEWERAGDREIGSERESTRVRTVEHTKIHACTYMPAHAQPWAEGGQESKEGRPEEGHWLARQEVTTTSSISGRRAGTSHDSPSGGIKRRSRPWCSLAPSPHVPGLRCRLVAGTLATRCRHAQALP